MEKIMSKTNNTSNSSDDTFENHNTLEDTDMLADTELNAVTGGVLHCCTGTHIPNGIIICR
jgi:hypothetical protein